MKRLELIELLAHAGKFDRPLRDFAHRERRAAARIAVELGQDEAGDVQRFVEMRRHAHRLLAGGGVGDEQHFLRLQESRSALISSISASSISCRPAVSKICTLPVCVFGPFERRLWRPSARPSRPAAA